MKNSLKSEKAKERYDRNYYSIETTFTQKELEEHNKEIRAKVIDEFAEKLIAHFNDWLYQEAPSNDDETDRTRHIICDTICDAIGGISEIAEQMKGE